jgi:hypothetical protein
LEDDTIHNTGQGKGDGKAKGRPGKSGRQRTWILLLVTLAALLVVLPAAVLATADTPAIHNGTGPRLVQVGVYVVDISNFNVADGTFGANLYLTLKSDAPVSLTDLDIANGHTTSVDTLLDTPNEKSFRVFATLHTNPDLHLYPFDRHTLPIEIEPKLNNANSMVLVIHGNSTGLEPDAGIPGWQLSGGTSRIISRYYDANETPYSRAVFEYNLQRDITSILLKFFLPILLLLVVSLLSLLMKGPSRLGINASMLIVAVFIHWRISDSIPLVSYATFLDIFMLITYVTIVLVLASGILIQKFTESGENARVEQINYWSLRIIPPLSIALYILLFLSLLL